MKNLFITFFAALFLVPLANSSEIEGFDCSNGEMFNTLKIMASVRFATTGTTANFQTSVEAKPTSLKQTDHLYENGVFVFTPNGKHPYKNNEDGAILIVDSNSAGYLSYRGQTVAIACKFVTGK